MDPAPDFGYDTYKGCGRLKGKVRMCCGAFGLYVSLLKIHLITLLIPGLSMFL